MSKLDIFLIGVGVACVLAAITGGSLKAAGVEIPVLHTRLQYSLFGLIGVSLFALGLYLHFYKPAGPPGPPAGVKAKMDSVGRKWATCPANATFTGSVDLAEGKGNVIYHLVVQYITGTSAGHVEEWTKKSVYFPHPGSQPISDKGIVYQGAGDVYWQIDDPITQASNVESFNFTCL